jgi:hypothetical protein
MGLRAQNAISTLTERVVCKKMGRVDPMLITFFDRKECYRLLIVSTPCGPDFESHLRT